MAKNKNTGAVEASMREMREGAAPSNGPTLAEAWGARKDPTDWRLNVPTASNFYMTTGSGGGQAHKPYENYKVGKTVTSPTVFYVRPACAVDEKTRVALTNGVDGYPVPYEGDLKCEYCLKGESAPVVTEKPKGSRTQRAARTEKQPAAFVWPKYKAEDPMAPVGEFFQTYHGLMVDGKTGAEANDLIPDDLRYRALKGFFKLHEAGPEAEALLEKTFGQSSKPKPKSSKQAARERLAVISSENLREEPETPEATTEVVTPEVEPTPSEPTASEAPLDETVAVTEDTPSEPVVEAETQPEPTVEITPEPEPTPEPEGDEPQPEPVSI